MLGLVDAAGFSSQRVTGDGVGAGEATHFEHQDWLGTERMRTTYNGGVEGSYISLPFGDGYAASGADTDANHYAQLDHDFESDTEYAQNRQYSNTQGRWLSPDPYRGSYQWRNPQSFNRYAYVGNNPLAAADPSGLESFAHQNKLYPQLNAPNGGNADTVDLYMDNAGGGGDGSSGGASDTSNTDTSSTDTSSTDTSDGTSPTSVTGDGTPVTVVDDGSGVLYVVDPSALAFMVSQLAISDLAEIANNAFNQCIANGVATAFVTGYAEGVLKEDSTLMDSAAAIEQNNIDLQRDCILSFPQAALSPNYSGMFQPSAPYVVGYFSTWF
jgi:RHS repeat-associated protein